MPRLLTAGLLVLALAVAGSLAQDKPAAPTDQDPPPVRLKKKNRPPAETPDPMKPAAKEGTPAPPEKPRTEPEKKPRLEEKPKKDAEPDVPEEPEKDEQEVLNRILKNSRTVEERLGNKELDDRTEQIQRDVLKDLDSLIEQTKQQQNQNQDQQQDPQSGAGQDQQKQQQQAGAPGSRTRRQQQQQQARGQGRRRNRQVTRRQGQKPGQQEQQGDSMQQPQGDRAENGGNQPGQGGKGATEEMNKLAEVYKDIWGHLPEALRAEMDAYGREEFMTRYKDVLRQYYATIAEKGKRKE